MFGVVRGVLSNFFFFSAWDPITLLLVGLGDCDGGQRETARETRATQVWWFEAGPRGRCSDSLYG